MGSGVIDDSFGTVLDQKLEELETLLAISDHILNLLPAS